MFVLLINLKRLINDIYSGEHIMTPPASPRLSVKNAAQSKLSPARAALTTMAEIFKSGVRSRSPSVKPGTTDADVSTLKKDKANKQVSMSYDDLSNEVGQSKNGPPDIGVLQGIFSSVIPWGADEEMDKLAFEKLGLTRPLTSVSLGTRG
jgi:hypothetical protein